MRHSSKRVADSAEKTVRRSELPSYFNWRRGEHEHDRQATLCPMSQLFAHCGSIVQVAEKIG